MKNKFVIGVEKLKLYMNENEGWQQVLQVQTNEIPTMKKMLNEIMEEEQLAREEKAGKNHFNRRLAEQQNEMQQLNNELGEQQKRLAMDCETNMQYDIDAFCTQDILRERIKAIEKTYIDLKCNFMNYLSIVF
jgi:hypothetical protein